MAIKNIDPNAGKESEEKDTELKPLVSKYGRKNPNIYKESHAVLSGKVSSSGEWCILETAEYTVLMNMKTSAMKELFSNILPALAGKKANALVIQPNKKAKSGAIVGVDDELEAWYTFDNEDEAFEIFDKDPNKSAKKSSSLSLDMFLGTSASTASANTTPEELEKVPRSTRTRKVVETDE